MHEVLQNQQLALKTKGDIYFLITNYYISHLLFIIMLCQHSKVDTVTTFYITYYLFRFLVLFKVFCLFLIYMC